MKGNWTFWPVERVHLYRLCLLCNQCSMLSRLHSFYLCFHIRFIVFDLLWWPNLWSLFLNSLVRCSAKWFTFNALVCRLRTIYLVYLFMSKIQLKIHETSNRWFQKFIELTTELMMVANESNTSWLTKKIKNSSSLCISNASDTLISDRSTNRVTVANVNVFRCKSFQAIEIWSAVWRKRCAIGDVKFFSKSLINRCNSLEMTSRWLPSAVTRFMTWLNCVDTPDTSWLRRLGWDSPIVDPDHKWKEKPFPWMWLE